MFATEVGQHNPIMAQLKMLALVINAGKWEVKC